MPGYFGNLKRTFDRQDCEQKARPSPEGALGCSDGSVERGAEPSCGSACAGTAPSAGAAAGPSVCSEQNA